MTPVRKVGPQQVRKCCVFVTRADARRLDAFIVKVGRRHAPELLGVGPSTLEIAREEFGRLLGRTHERLFAALDEQEAKAS